MSRIELESWHTVCIRLLQAGAITDDDLEAPQSSRDTDGRCLLAAIREWGNHYAARLAKAVPLE